MTTHQTERDAAFYYAPDGLRWQIKNSDNYDTMGADQLVGTWECRLWDC